MVTIPVSIPIEWLKKGARFSIKSAIFGQTNATVTDVEERTFSYRPEKHNVDFAVSMTKMALFIMIMNGTAKPL